MTENQVKTLKEKRRNLKCARTHNEYINDCILNEADKTMKTDKKMFTPYTNECFISVPCVSHKNSYICS